MNLRHLETFHTFCQCMSMTRAAILLSVSQPAVSQQLRSFEEECGVKLFYREDNRYKLTETGEALFLVSKRIFSRVDQIDTLLDQARKASRERLWIGTTKAYARTVMPDLIARFQKQFPRIHVRLSEGNSKELIARLRSRREDVVIVARTEYDSCFRAIPFARAKFILVARPDHELARRGTASIKALDGEPLIIREEGSGSRRAIMSRLSQNDVKPSVVIESESLSFILAYIQRRMGISFVLSHEIEDQLAKGVVRQINLEEGEISFDADLVARRDEPLSVPTRYFIKIARKRG